MSMPKYKKGKYTPPQLLKYLSFWLKKKKRQIFKRSKEYKTQFQNTSARKAQQQTGSECKGFKSGD